MVWYCLVLVLCHGKAFLSQQTYSASWIQHPLECSHLHSPHSRQYWLLSLILKAALGLGWPLELPWNGVKAGLNFPSKIGHGIQPATRHPHGIGPVVVSSQGQRVWRATLSGLSGVSISFRWEGCWPALPASTSLVCVDNLVDMDENTIPSIISTARERRILPVISPHVHTVYKCNPLTPFSVWTHVLPTLLIRSVSWGHFFQDAFSIDLHPG